MRKPCLLLPILLVLAGCAATQPPPPPPVGVTIPPPVVQTVQLTEDLGLGFSLRLDDWTVDREPPAFLLEEMAEHLEHELEAKGLTRSHAELIDIAAQRLAANELFITRPSGRAWIVVDVSPLRTGEKRPSRRAVYSSAVFAGESLTGEEGVADVTFTVDSVGVSGADAAFRLDAAFTTHGAPRRFAGIVAFADPYWLYIYYTDTLADPADEPYVDGLLDNLTLVRR